MKIAENYLEVHKVTIRGRVGLCQTGKTISSVIIILNNLLSSIRPTRDK